MCFCKAAKEGLTAFLRYFSEYVLRTLVLYSSKKRLSFMESFFFLGASDSVLFSFGLGTKDFRNFSASLLSVVLAVYKLNTT